MQGGRADGHLGLSVSGKKQLPVKFTCQLDSGATCNVQSRRDYLKLGKPWLEHSSVTLTMYDGSVRRSIGKCTLQLAAEAISKLEFEVLDTKHHLLLSLDTCLELGLFKYNIEEVCIVHSDQELTHSRICEEYSDLFSGIGCLPGEYDIDLYSNIPPVQNRPRKVPHMMKSTVEEKIRSLVQCGVLAPVECPTEWISNLTAVWKADKKQV